MSDPRPLIAQKGSYPMAVEAGKSYWWCASSKSQSQSFCGGSHKGGGFNTIEFKTTGDGQVWFCGCKQRANTPRCDGTHNTL